VYVYLPLFIFPCTIKPRSSLLAPAHPGGPGNRAVKRLWFDSYGVDGNGATERNLTEVFVIYAA